MYNSHSHAPGSVLFRGIALLQSFVFMMGFSVLALPLTASADGNNHNEEGDGNSTIHIVKIIDTDGNLDTAGDQTHGAGWSFTIGDNTVITDQNGNATVHAEHGSHDVIEVAQDGYTLVSSSCTLNSHVHQGDDEDVHHDGEKRGHEDSENDHEDHHHHDVKDVDAHDGDSITCTFYNTPTTVVTPPAENHAPVANNQSLTTDEGVATSTTLTGSDADVGDTLVFATSTNPTSGTVTGTVPNVTYTPNSGFTGSDSFDFTVGDGLATSTGTITIIVTATPPVDPICTSGQHLENHVCVPDSTSNDTSTTDNSASVSSGSGHRGGGGGCSPGFVWDSHVIKCVPKDHIGQVLGASCGLYLDQHMRRGNAKNDSEQVKKLQQFLNDHGFGPIEVTGFFGSQTQAAVSAFQSAHSDDILKPWNLSHPTGLVYLTTLRHINLISCPSLTIPIPELVPWS